MRVVERKRAELSGPESDEIMGFLENHYSTIFHDEKFNTIVADIYHTDFSYQLVYDRENTLIAVCPYHSYTQGPMRITHSNPTIYEVPYGGWIYDERECDIRDLLRFRKTAMNEVLFYWSTPGVGRCVPDSPGRRTTFKTSFIELGETEENILQTAINGKRRNMIRKAVKSGVQVEILDADRFDIFSDLLNQTYAAARITLKPSTFHEQVLKSYESSERSVVMTARYHNEIIAAIMLVRNALMCHYWLGANSAASENLGQGELLQWEAIKWAKKHGCRYYDLCVIEEERLPNIARFKMGFSHKIIPFYCLTQRGMMYRLMARSRLWH